MVKLRSLFNLKLKTALLITLFSTCLDAFIFPRLASVTAYVLLAVIVVLSWSILFTALTKSPVWTAFSKVGLGRSIAIFTITNSLVVLLYSIVLPRGRWLFPWLVGFASIGWARIFAAIASHFRWTPRKCYLLPAVLFMVAGSIQFMVAARSDLFVWGMLIGLLCKKMVYPDMGWDQGTKPEPPITLFSGRVP